MSDATVILTPREQHLVCLTADRYQSTDTLAGFLLISDIPMEDGETRNQIVDLADKLVRLGFLEHFDNVKLKILPSVIHAANQIRNPPVRNYFNEITKWWFSARWRAIITVLFVVLSAIVQWIEMLQQCLMWLLGPRA
jgi:hypothetical protein